MELGTIYGIGVGPGDPRLLTLRAVEVLQTVDAVLVPRSREDRESLALSIAKPHLPAQCEVLEAVFPMTEARGVLEAAWRHAAERMLERSQAGSAIAFLTLGDAMLYSTWSYLLTAIKALNPGAPLETVPGITAMSACAAAAGSPLAEGRAPLLVWPDAPPADAERLFAVAPNVVFMKASRHLEPLAALADTVNADAVAVRRVTLPEQQVTHDLRSWAGDGEYFTTVVMHRREE